MSNHDYWTTLLDEAYPDSAPHEVGLASARGLLSKLNGVRVLAAVADEGIGPCDDCGRERERLLYGRVVVCWTCSFLRSRASAKAEAA
jgi:hypothetical protein